MKKKDTGSLIIHSTEEDNTLTSILHTRVQLHHDRSTNDGLEEITRGLGGRHEEVGQCSTGSYT